MTEQQRAVRSAADQIFDAAILRTISRRANLRTPEVYRENRLPVDIIQFVEDPYYLGGQVELQPAVRDALWDIEDPEIREADLEVGKGCIPVGTPVFDPWSGGPVPFGEIRPRAVVGMLRERLVAAPYHAVARTGPKPCVRVLTNFGTELVTSTDHGYRTWNGWTRAGDLRSGDWVAAPRRLPFFEDDPEEFTIQEARLLGYFIGDGCTRNRARLSVNRTETGLIEDVTTCLESLGVPRSMVQVRPKKKSAKGAEMSVKVYGQEDWPDKWRSTSGRRVSPLRQLMERAGLMGLDSHTKHIPHAVWRFGREKLRHFLAALWVTDGSIGLRKGARGVHGDVAYTSVSRLLVEEIRFLLLKLGIRSKIRSRNMRCQTGAVVRAHEISAAFAQDSVAICELPLAEKTQRAGAVVRALKGNPKTRDDVFPLPVWGWLAEDFAAAGGTRRRGPKASLMARDAQGRLRFTRNSMPSRGQLARWARVLRSDRIQELVDSDIMWERVEKVTPEGVRECADVVGSGAGDAFVAGTFVTHNSGKSEISSVSTAYGAYLLTWMRHPQQFFGLAPSTIMASVNVSTSRPQAKDVVFQGIKGKVEASPYFQSLAPQVLNVEIQLPNNVRIYCGHSGDRAFLGFALFRGVMDEVNYMVDSQNRNVARQLYDALHGSMKTRFPHNYKLISVSSVTQPSTWLHRRVVQAERDGVPYVGLIRGLRVTAVSAGRVRVVSPAPARPEEILRTLALEQRIPLRSLGPWTRTPEGYAAEGELGHG